MERSNFREEIKRALASNDIELTSITFSELSHILSRDLNVSEEVISSHKDDIADVLLELCSVDHNVQENSVERGKKGKFSATETKIILDEVHRYMRENDLAIEDICPELREEKKRTNHQVLWSYIQTLLPLRNKDQIYNHAIRKLTEEGMKKGPWSSEEKDALRSLVSIHGHDWRKISRILNRASFDCKDAYKILFERKSSGRFSKAEDDELIAAVRKACQIPDSIPVSEMPSVNISWLNVAAALNNIRLPLDYQRRWGVLRLTCKDQVETNQSKENQELIETKQNLTLEIDLKILRYLDERNVSDETEVIWTDIDEALNLPKNKSYPRWKAMCKKMNFSLHDDFTTRLETLLIAHGVDDFTAADSSVPLSTSQAEVIEIEEPMTVTTLIPEFMPPQVESHEEPNVAMEGIRKKKRRREKEERKKKRKAKEARLERILSSSDRGKEGKDQCEEVLSRR